MQRTFVAITLAAIALTGVMGGFNPTNFVKAPVVVIQDNETNFTNSASTSTLSLASITIGDVYLTAANYTQNLANVSSTPWNLYLKKLESKALTTGSLTSYNFNSSLGVFYVNNYAIGLSSDKETNNSTNLVVFQVPLTGGAALPKLTYTNNTNDTAFIPSFEDAAIIGKVVYIFYKSADKTVNVTSFTVGGTLSTTKFGLTSAYTDGLEVAWGEALGTSKLFAMWRENGTLKDSAVDLSKGTVTVNTVEGYNSTIHTCHPYTTDKTWFGELCTSENKTSTNQSEQTITYWTRTNTTTLFALATYPITNPAYAGNYPYGPYLVIDFADRTNATANLHSYEIWNLDTRTLFRNRTLYLQVNSTATEVSKFRVISGGLYTLLHDSPVTVNGTKGTITNVQVGLLLGSSNIASVLGFLLTIIAGLLLF